MRVLLVNRGDAERDPGGDVIQQGKTTEALEAMGVVVHTRATNELDELPDFDVAHVFNLQTFAESTRAFEALRHAGAPIVLSSIFWDVLDHWFDLALGTRGRWRRVVGILGRPRARDLYVGWQRIKRPATESWRLQRRLLARAAHVLPNSRSEALLLQDFFLLHTRFQEKVTVVPNGVDAALFAPRIEPPRAPADLGSLQDCILQVGALSPVKNQLGLIETLYDLPARLVFVGHAAPAKPEYADACRARGAQRGNVVFLDSLPHGELPGLYALAAVHVLPSWRETPGLASLEAAAAGCRVVTTSIGSAREYFGEHAWYCRPDDPASIRRAVESALRTPRSTVLRDHVLANFTWQRAAQVTLEAYRAVLQAKPARSGRHG